MKPANYQKKVLIRHTTNIGFRFPCCQSEVVDRIPEIENPGEKYTQIFCPYGCGFIALESYDTPKSK